MGSANHTRRARITPKQSSTDLFFRISDEERAEYGSSYSGTFGSKDSVRTFKTNLSPRQFTALESIIWDTVFTDEIPKTKAQSIERRTIEKVGAANIIFFATIANDKFGPALGLRNKNGSIIFMGMCSE